MTFFAASKDNVVDGAGSGRYSSNHIQRPMNAEQTDGTHSQNFNRREFLKQTVAGAGLAATGTAAFSQESTAIPDMPMIQLGSHQVSRLIVGSNPMLGYSHSSGLLSRRQRRRGRLGHPTGREHVAGATLAGSFRNPRCRTVLAG